MDKLKKQIIDIFQSINDWEECFVVFREIQAFADAEREIRCQELKRKDNE